MRIVAADDGTFVRDTAPFRRELLALCYRMLGSVDDAEDIVVLTATSTGISKIVSFGDPELLPKFGFPTVLPT